MTADTIVSAITKSGVWKLLESGFAFEIDCYFWMNANGEGEESWAITPNEKVVKDQASSCTCEANTLLLPLEAVESLENLRMREVTDFEDDAGFPSMEPCQTSQCRLWRKNDGNT